MTPEVPDAEPAPAPSGADVAVLPVGQLAGALQTAALDPTAAPTAGPDLAATVVPGTATVALDGPPAETDATTPGWAAPSEPGAPTPVSVCTNVTGTGRGSPPVLATSSRQPAPTGAPVVAAVAPTPPAPDPTPPAPPLPSPPPPLAPPPAPTTGVTASSGCAFAGGAQDDDPALHDAVSSTSATVAACAASVRQIELAAELATDDGHTPGSRPD